MKIDDLLKFSVNLKFKISKACVVHGIATWFDTVFNGSTHQVVLSTNPRNSTTHWYQVRLLLKEPIALNKNQILKGKITFTANKFQSYNIELELKADSLSTYSYNEYDLKNPDFRTGSFSPNN
jgi:histone-arginine methyltransferase CARM1